MIRDLLLALVGDTASGGDLFQFLGPLFRLNLRQLAGGSLVGNNLFPNFGNQWLPNPAAVASGCQKSTV